MKVLVACEYSGRVRDAFRRLGHDAISCDLLETETPGPHSRLHIFDFLQKNPKWDLMIAHPPCTYLTVSGARWFYHPDDKVLPVEQRRPHPKFPARAEDRAKAVDFIERLWRQPIPQIAIENPIGVLPAHSFLMDKPSQIIQPWQFGHGETKATCLWLKNLPLLTPTKIVDGRKQSVFHLPPSKDRWKERSRTYQGIADAMAEQWGGWLCEQI